MLSKKFLFWIIQKANLIPGCISTSIASSFREMVFKINKIFLTEKMFLNYSPHHWFVGLTNKEKNSLGSVISAVKLDLGNSMNSIRLHMFIKGRDIFFAAESLWVLIQDPSRPVHNGECEIVVMIFQRHSDDFGRCHIMFKLWSICHLHRLRVKNVMPLSPWKSSTGLSRNRIYWVRFIHYFRQKMKFRVSLAF